MRIVLIGPESTGKSTLAAQLAAELGIPYIEEYARAYVEQLGRPYTYRDVENIARHQCEEIKGEGVFDTELIVTKVWFIDKYGTYPAWIDDALDTWKPDICLLLKPDLPFVPDPVRENGDRREELFGIYRREIEKHGFPYTVISGFGEERLKCALAAVRTLIGK